MQNSKTNIVMSLSGLSKMPNAGSCLLSAFLGALAVLTNSHVDYVKKNNGIDLNADESLNFMP
jgi:hypothetical protein